MLIGEIPDQYQYWWYEFFLSGAGIHDMSTVRLKDASTIMRYVRINTPSFNGGTANERRIIQH